MSTPVSEIEVSLGARSYRIFIGAGLLENAGRMITNTGGFSSCAVVTHPTLAAPYASKVMQSLQTSGLRTELITLPAGERYKTLSTVSRIYEKLIAFGLDRKSLIVTVGGGVLGDVGGFVAATYLRGISFVQVPTTLLAQVDASVGGKTAVDLPQGKNLVGAFHQPRAVIIDTNTLSTLPLREIRAGLAEVMKYGIISDNEFFNRLHIDIPLMLKRESGSFEDAIARSCEIKADVVTQDETEQGVRAILNFGHTVGHAIEALSGFRRLLHGEAVAIGMVSASLIGEEMGITPEDVTADILSLLRKAHLPWALPEDIKLEDILSSMMRDKKTLSRKLNLVLAEKIGSARLYREISQDIVLRALKRHAALSPDTE